MVKDRSRYASPQAVVDWLAEKFGYAEQDLPKGWKMDPSFCPVARGIKAATGKNTDVNSLKVMTQTLIWFIWRRHGPPPPAVRLFLREFDDGMWPEYDAWEQILQQHEHEKAIAAHDA